MTNPNLPGASRAAEPTSFWLFVYGSLKRGRANHGELHATEYLAVTRTAPFFALRVVHGYPALVPGTRAIVGELYRIPSSALPALDEFEGSDYVRQEIELAGSERAFAYLARVSSAGDAYPGDEWPTP